MRYRRRRPVGEIIVSTITILITIAVVIYLFAACVGSLDNRIVVNKAVVRFEELAQTEDVEMIRHTNLSYIFGDPHDVIFELLIDDKPISGRCTSASFSEMVCRLYTGDE
jgi:hypothetical protein